MTIERVDLGVCAGYTYDLDAPQTAVVLPGAMLGGAPVSMFAVYTLLAAGFGVVQVWDEYDGGDRIEWARRRAEAALDAAPSPRLVAAKSVTTLVTPLAAERGLAGIWLTPLLHLPECVEGLRARTAPALLVGGTADESWDGQLARELSPDVLELAGADHGFLPPDESPRGTLENMRLIVDAIEAFAARL